MEREEWWREEAGTNILLVHTLKYEPKKTPKGVLESIRPKSTQSTQVWPSCQRPTLECGEGWQVEEASKDILVVL